MRTLIASIAFAVVAFSCGQASAATGGFSDAICPEATQYVIAVGKLRKDDSPQRIYDAVQPAVDAYQRCSKEKLANGFREPQHYADVRAGGLAVIAARALVALNRPDDAKRELLQWRPLVQQVVDWQSETQTIVQGHNRTDKPDGTNAQGGVPDPATNTVSSDHRPSVYRASAKEVVVAIDEELGKLADMHPASKP